MKLLNWIKGVVNRMFKNDVKRIFNTDVLMSSPMAEAAKSWCDIVGGRPEWIDKEDNIDTINFAKFITSDTAKKVCLDIDIHVDGSGRADYLQTAIDSFKKVLRDKVEDACAAGGIMLKPNGSGNVKNCINYVAGIDFIITEKTANGDITGAVFCDYIKRVTGIYTRMEYHRFENELYIITNKAYYSTNDKELGREIDLDEVPEWSNIDPEVAIENITAPLFAYFKMPFNNTVDKNSPLGVSVFSNAIKELKDLDIAWSRKSGEVEDSKHMTFLDSNSLGYSKTHNIKLPRFVKGIDMGVTNENSIHEHVATLLTEQRINDINSILSMISTKCGFSQGQFILDRKTGHITATQVEADDRETIETIKDIRDSLKDAVDHLIYALDVYATLYHLAPAGSYETSYGFGDLTYNFEEDRARHWNYVLQGKYPLWRYYNKFEGMSESEAKAIVKEAKEENSPEEKPGIFNGGNQ